MKRIIVIAAMVAIAAATAFGAPTQEESDGNEPVTIRFNQHGNNWVRDLRVVSEPYEEMNPNVTIEISRLGGDDFWASLRTVLASGDVHDLFAVQAGSMLNDFVDAGHLEPIDDLDVASNYAEGMRAIGTFDGTLYGLPPSSNTMGVLYNQDIFDELGLDVPRTIPEFEEVVAAISEAGYVPFAGYYNDVWTLRHLFSMVHTPVVGDAATFVAEMNSGARDTFWEPGMDRAMDVVDLMHNNISERPFDATFGDATALVAQEVAAMIIQGQWALGNILSINPDFNAGMFALPISDDPADATLHADSAVVWSVYSGGDNIDQAKDYLNWLMGTEPMQALGDIGDDLMAVAGFVAKGPIAPISNALQSYLEQGLVDRWGFNKWPTGFDMDVVAPAVQDYLRTGDRDALFERIDSQYPN